MEIEFTSIIAGYVGRDPKENKESEAARRNGNKATT